jgi:hypothetical protein
LARISTVPHRLVIGSTAMPEICVLKQATGLPCPGCGLTRSWVALAQGDLSTSLGFHRFGWLVMIYAMLQVLRHGAWLLLQTRQLAIERLGAILDRAIIPLGALLVVNWVWVLAIELRSA